MKQSIAILLALLAAQGGQSCAQVASEQAAPSARSVAFTNGRWFDGSTFRPRTLYSVDGRFSVREPFAIDRTIDLAGAFVVPPFAEAHNHNIGTGDNEFDRGSVDRYLAAGVFYVKIQGNLPLNAEQRRRLGLNTAQGLDVQLAQGSLTGTGGHPVALVEGLLGRGFYAGHTRETLKDHRYFTINSAAELDRKWLRILALQPDFLKTFLLYSDEYERRKDDPAFFGLKGLDPRLLPVIIAKAHAQRLRVTTHVITVADFRNAVTAGADEIAHIPMAFLPPSLGGPYAELLQEPDAQLAAKRGTVVITTFSALTNAGVRATPDELARIRDSQVRNLSTLLRAGVTVAVGSDNPSDTSVGEVDLLLQSDVLDKLRLLRMWTGATARAIFPERKIGALEEGYEASFLALEENPLEDWNHVRRIRLRFKQGAVLDVRADAVEEAGRPAR